MRSSEEAYPQCSSKEVARLLFLKTFIYCMCPFMCVGTHAIASKWRSEGTTQKLALSWCVVLGTEFRPLGLVARTFICQTISSAPFFVLFVFEKENISYCQEGLYVAHSHLELLGSEILLSQVHHTVPVREVLSLSPSCPKTQRCPIFDPYSKAKFQLIMTHKSLQLKGP